MKIWLVTAKDCGDTVECRPFSTRQGAEDYFKWVSHLWTDDSTDMDEMEVDDFNLDEDETAELTKEEVLKLPRFVKVAWIREHCLALGVIPEDCWLGNPDPEVEKYASIWPDGVPETELDRVIREGDWEVGE